MGKLVKRAYKYRFYPTPEQATELSRTFGCVRLVYNRALDARTVAYQQRGERVTYVQTSAMLTEWKQADGLAFLREVSSVPLQQALRHLQGAFVNFWDKRAKYPTFKSKKKSRASAEYTRSAFKWRDGQLTLAKLACPLDIVWSRPLPVGAEPSTVDAGLTTLATLSTGEKITNPRHERADRKRLAKAQRALARKEKGSNNRAKARVKVARVHARITDRRRDYLHKLTTRLVRENQTVVIEDLTVRNMVGNHSLARAISDAAWRQLRGMLEYKAGWYGRNFVVVDRWFPSSRMCSSCGRLAESMPLNVREWTCPCGAVHDRDVNAALNIRAAGLVDLNACGGPVRPEPRKRERRGPSKQEPRPARVGIPAL